MKRKKIVILPKLNDAGGNLSKKWFVYYSVRDPRTDKMERFKDHVGLSHPDESVRRERADKIIQELTVKLKKGWTPFLDDTEAISINMWPTYMVPKRLLMLLFECLHLSISRKRRKRNWRRKQYKRMLVNYGC